MERQTLWMGRGGLHRGIHSDAALWGQRWCSMVGNIGNKQVLEIPFWIAKDLFSRDWKHNLSVLALW